jgi:4-hydroxybenzoate polyprenyltransferase
LNIIEAKLRNSNFKYFRRFLIIFTSSSLFIATSGCLKTFFSFSLYGITPSFPLLLATFMAIYSVYGLNKITDTEEDQLNAPERSNLISSNEKLFKYTSGACYIFAVAIAILYGWKVLLIILFPLMAGIIYSIKIHPRIPRLKDIFAVKSLIVALSWTVGNTFLPLVDQTETCIMTHLIVISAIFSFFFIKSFINTILFDLMDVEGDRKIGARTIPVVLGYKYTIKLLIILNTVHTALLLISITFGFFQSMIIPMVFCLIYGYIYILYFYHNQNRFQMDVLVDGEWILLVFISLMK